MANNTMPSKIIISMVTKDDFISQQVDFRRTSYEMARHNVISSRSIRRFKEKRANSSVVGQQKGSTLVQNEILLRCCLVNILSNSDKFNVRIEKFSFPFNDTV